MRWSKQWSRKKALSVGLVLLTLAAGILIGTLVNTDVKAQRQQAVTDATPLTIPSPVELANDFTALVKKMEPAVVNIATSYDTSRALSRRRQQQQDPQAEPAPPDDSLERWRRFFGIPDDQELPQPNRRGGGTGSGFIVDPKGYIITNYHVVEDADRIIVKLHGDPAEYRARLIGFDTETDLAVIKIEGDRPFPHAAVGNSDGVQVGDWAVAIGSPFGLDASVTAGIVSAKGRDIAGARQFQRFIQTDAAINPGNSGGPLLNIQGQVIGVNTMIATSTGSYNGIGFALPVNTAVKVYNQLIQYGRVTRGSIGISFSPEPRPDLLKALGVESGVLVDSVTRGGPSEKAGIRPEDIIIEINGTRVVNGDDLVARVADTPVGDTLAIRVDRAGKKLNFEVAVGDRSEVFRDDPRFRTSQTRPPAEVPSDTGQDVRFGIMVREATPGDLESRSVSGQRGVIVTQILENSFAGEIGIRAGDMILSINRQPVASVEDIRKVQGSLKPGAPVAFYVSRQSGADAQGNPRYTNLYVSGTLPR